MTGQILARPRAETAALIEAREGAHRNKRWEMRVYECPVAVSLAWWCASLPSRLAVGFASVHWVRVLGRYAREVNPLLRGLLSPMQYYWVTSQAEYSTDVLFLTRDDLEELMPRLLQYSTLYFEARDVMAFLGRKLNGNFQGDLVTDQLDFSQLPRRRDRIIAKQGLRNVPMSELVGESHHYADFCFAYGAAAPPPPAFVSTVKVKRAGFVEVYDTEETFRYRLGKLIERRILPPPGG